MPTLLELAGVAKPNDLDGKSLVSILKGEEAKGHEHLFWSNGRDQWVVINGKWKLAHNTGWTHVNYETMAGKNIRAQPYHYGGGVQLYDLETDIAESKDLSGTYPEKVEELNGLYWQWRERMSDPRTGRGKRKEIPGGYPQRRGLPEGISNVYCNGAQINHYAAKAFDGDATTYWQSKTGFDAAIPPYEIITVFEQKTTVIGFELLPVKNKRISQVKSYVCFASENNIDWHLVVDGTFKEGTLPKRVKFSEPVDASFLKLQVEDLYGEAKTTAIAELEWLY